MVRALAPGAPARRSLPYRIVSESLGQIGLPLLAAWSTTTEPLLAKVVARQSLPAQILVAAARSLPPATDSHCCGLFDRTQRARQISCQSPCMRLAGVQDEKQEAQEPPPVRHLVVGEQLGRGVGRDPRLADDGYPESGRGEGVGHRMQRPGPETKECGLPSRGPLIDPVVGREVIGLAAGLAVAQERHEGMVN